MRALAVCARSRLLHRRPRRTGDGVGTRPRACGIPVEGVSTLEAHGRSRAAAGSSGWRRVLDAGRGELVVERFAVDADAGALTRSGDSRLLRDDPRSGGRRPDRRAPGGSDRRGRPVAAHDAGIGPGAGRRARPRKRGVHSSSGVVFAAQRHRSRGEPRRRKQRQAWPCVSPLPEPYRLRAGRAVRSRRGRADRVGVLPGPVEARVLRERAGRAAPLRPRSRAR